MSLYWKQISIVLNFVSLVPVFGRYTTIRYPFFLSPFQFSRDVIRSLLLVNPPNSKFLGQLVTNKVLEPL